MPVSNPRRRSGFTLIELIAVVTIVGAVMSIFAPRFRIARSTELQLAGMQMAQDIDVTRTRALSTRLLTRVAFNNATRQYGGYLDHDGNGTVAQTAAEWQALRGFGERPLPKGISFGRGAAPGLPDDASSSAITFTNSRVEFDSRGLVTPANTSGVVYLTADVEPKAVVAISVAPSGNTRFWTWSPEKGWR
ncbi:MAG TPA: type II secretion system protein [Gemmatimonas sp.]|uniref:pilus assembly FimT family protein n=1 Tax=Gemmatimonas sp. TaxID=1962908 RepID=UPI002EDA07F7